MERHIEKLESLRKAAGFNHNEQILNSWKEIATYLNRGVRTIQRWEAELKMPVRRPYGRTRSAVVAVRAELDEWIARAPSRARENNRPRRADFLAVPAKVLVVEDSVKDLSTCVSVLRSIGVRQLDVISNVPVALRRLKDIVRGKAAKPEIIILDLAFPLESGFEILRYWQATPALKSISIVVWTAMGDSEQQLGTIFEVHRVMPKWTGAAELEQAGKVGIAAA